MAACDDTPTALAIEQFVADMAYVQTFVETEAPTATTPQGNSRTTLAGFEAQGQAAIANTGWFPVAGSFEDGGTITERNQYLQLVTTVGSDVAGGYSWGGTLPKSVGPGSTPATTGGTGPDAWVYRSDTTLRSGLAASDSTVPIAGSPAFVTSQKFNVIKYMTAAQHMSLLADNLDVDHSSAFIAAVAAAQAGSARNIFVPSGYRYRLSADVEITSRYFGVVSDSAAGALIYIDDNVNGFVFDSVVMSEVYGLRFLPLNGSIAGQKGIWYKNSGRKHIIRGCYGESLEYGVLANNSWTIWMQDTHFNDCTRNFASYRTTSGGQIATTVVIQRGSLMNFSGGKGYSISIGEAGQADFAAGVEHCTTLWVQNVAMDGTKNYIGSTNNIQLKGNHAENSLYPNEPLWLIDSTQTGFVCDISDGNFIQNYDEGIKLTGANFRAVKIKGNYFRDITNEAISAQDYTTDDIDVDNFYSSVGVELALAVSTSTGNEAAPNRSGNQSPEGLYVNGSRVRFLTSTPTSGRYKNGDIVAVKPNNTAIPQIKQFDAGGSSSTILGNVNLGASPTTGNAVATGNTVTPVDISLFNTGDRLVITGADTGGTDLSCVVRFIDYAAGTFQTIPTIKTDAVATTIAFDGASDSIWRILQGYETKSQAIANGASATVFTLQSQSTYRLHVRRSSNSNDYKSIVIGTGTNAITANELISTTATFTITSSGLNLTLNNVSAGSETFVMALEQIRAS